MEFAIDTFPEERFGLVTGSKCSVLFPLKGDGAKGQNTYAKELANEKFFKFYDERGGWQTEHGKMAEHEAFAWYIENVDKRLTEGRWIKDGECGGSTDAELPEKGIDFKCPTTLKAWLDYLHDPLSKEQTDQCQMYMKLSGKDQWDICAFLTETQFMTDNGLTYPVPHDKRMIHVPVKKDPFFEEKLSTALPYVISMRDFYTAKLKAQFLTP